MPKKHPRYLYKYRELNEYTKEIVRDGTLWFSTPQALNDPFDCAPVLSTDYTEESWCNTVRADLRLANPVVDEATLEAAVQQALETRYPPTTDELEAFKERYEERVSGIGVFSASARWDSVVMWSHYACKHSGVCIEIDVGALSPNIPFHKASYAETRPVVNLFSDRETANLTAAITKNCEWKYEDEWRLILEPPSPELAFPCKIDVPIACITGVLLGARISTSDRAHVLDWVDDSEGTPTVYETFLHKHSFRIDRRAVA